MDDERTERFEEVRALLAGAVADGVFPGAAFAVALRGAYMASGAVGRFTYDPASPPVEPDTAYDLASLTKVLAPTVMAMLLWGRGRLELDMPVGDLLPGFVIGGAPGRRLVTLRLLLAHASGLPGYARFFETCGSADAVLRAALTLPLQAAPGERAEYSDPGFILLGKALEVLAGERLDSFCGREIFKPLGMADTSFGPRRTPVPPTEDDCVYRMRVVEGEVHDENCWAMGGVCGHAGLFAPAGDVLRFAEAMLAALRGAPSLFTAEAVRLFTRRAELPPGSPRALGWDMPSGSHSSAGSRFSRLSFGHLGYTGTSLWIDPEHDFAAALLTNRTFPTRENRKIQELRPRFHDAVARAVSI